MLEIEELDFVYDGFAMHYSLSVARGSCTALIGPSGGGKTTLLNLVAGFAPPLRGQIRFDGRDITRLAPDQRPCTMLFQEHNLFPHLTAAQNVGLGLNPGLRLTDADLAVIDDALSAVGLDGLASRLPRQLSGGQRQRVALARALVRRHPLLLLDEPFSALDPGRRQEMLGLLDDLRQTHGLTLLMASHNPADAARIADRVVFIDEGQIQREAPPAELFGITDDPRLERYLGKQATPS